MDLNEEDFIRFCVYVIHAVEQAWASYAILCGQKVGICEVGEGWKAFSSDVLDSIMSYLTCRNEQGWRESSWKKISEEKELIPLRITTIFVNFLVQIKILKVLSKLTDL